ncbi:MAG: 4Fe-4S binding protein [Anaerolineales bacterium]
MAEQMAPRLDLSWKKANEGGVVYDSGNSVTYNTGSWRSMRPVWDSEQCVHCMTCWIMCPDSSILVEDGQMQGIDYDHCKGCGICSQVCPVSIKEPHAFTDEQSGSVIHMVPESDSE